MAQGLVLDWVKKLGYQRDPFEDVIFEPASRMCVGFERAREKINLFLLKGYSFGTIAGESGFGKTILLRWLREQVEAHGGSMRVVLVEDEKNLSDEQRLFSWIVQSLLSVYEKFITRPQEKLSKEELLALVARKVKKRKTLVLVDNGHLLSKGGVELLLRIARMEGAHVIVAGRTKGLHKLPLKAKGVKDDLRITLPKLSADELEEMIRRRIAFVGGQGLFPFDKRRLRTLAGRLKGGPREFLALCREDAIRRSLKVEGPPPVRSDDAGQENKGAKPLIAVNVAPEGEATSRTEEAKEHAPAAKTATEGGEEEGKERGKGSLIKIKLGRRKEIPLDIVPKPEELEDGLDPELYEPFRHEGQKKDAEMLSELVKDIEEVEPAQEEVVVLDDDAEVHEEKEKKRRKHESKSKEARKNDELIQSLVVSKKRRRKK